ncbi:hypothetical protein CNMCM7927_005789 [Aspergillus lentulus]|nr:hypothetical protein CNMCM7927_005789 [Aspergillus lentulus]
MRLESDFFLHFVMSFAFKTGLTLRCAYVKNGSSRLTNGKPLYAREAIKRGLVDRIGCVNEIFKFIKDQELLRVTNVPAYRDSKIRSSRKAIRALDSMEEQNYSTDRTGNDQPDAGSTKRERSHSRQPKI